MPGRVFLALRQPRPTVMSLMGWSSESMAARYQHVTDAIRTDVATKIGDLIWHPSSAGLDEDQLVPVRRKSLAAVLSFAEERMSGRQAAGQLELLAAIGDLRAALAQRTAAPASVNETKTETERARRSLPES